MRRQDRFAIIPTYHRKKDLFDCASAIAPQVGHILVLDNADEQPMETTWELARHLDAVDGTIDHMPILTLAWIDMTPPNLSDFWARGIDWAASVVQNLNLGYDPTGSMAELGSRERIGPVERRWYVAVLNDDVVVPRGWFDAVQRAMEETGAAAGAAYEGTEFVHHTKPGTTRIDQRMPGYAFMLAGHKGINADPQFHWWCGDNDLDMQARTKGGTVLVPGWHVEHRYPDQSTVGVLRERTAVDMELFVEKWGFRPW